MALILIAIRNLFGEKGRLLITIGGVAFSVTLILILLGLYQGWTKQTTRFLGNIKADIWVGQKGTENMSHSVSILPTKLIEEIENISNVNKVYPLISRQTSFKIRGEEAHLFLVAAEEDSAENEKIVSPYKMVKGKSNISRGEIIIDETFAKDKNLSLGDTLSINKVELEIVGISSGGNLLVYTYALANMEDLRQIFNSREFNNYYLVQSKNPEKAERSLKDKFEDLEIIPKQEFLENNAQLVKDTFLPIIGVLLLIAIAVGVAVIGLTIFTATIEKSREYGVLKAIGFSSGQLYLISLIQSLIAGVIGFILGWGLSFLVVLVAQTSVIGFIYEVQSLEINSVFVATLMMSILASFVPLKRLVAIDPAMVFKA